MLRRQKYVKLFKERGITATFKFHLSNYRRYNEHFERIAVMSNSIVQSQRTVTKTDRTIYQLVVLKYKKDDVRFGLSLPRLDNVNV